MGDSKELSEESKENDKQCVLYLHGWGGGEDGIAEINGREYKDHMYAAIKQNLAQNVQLFAPNWHQPSYMDFTVSFGLKYIKEYIDTHFDKDAKITIIGYSFGGYLATLLSSDNKYHHKIQKLILLAPALDNYERRIKTKSQFTNGFMTDLKQYSLRPKLNNTAIIVHGMDDNDKGGGDISRIDEYVKEQNDKYIEAYHRPKDNHGLGLFIQDKQFKTILQTQL